MQSQINITRIFNEFNFKISLEDNYKLQNMQEYLITYYMWKPKALLMKIVWC